MPEEPTPPRKSFHRALVFPLDGFLSLCVATDNATTSDQARETVGIFLCKGMYRQVENQYFMVPPDKAARLSPKARRLLGYAISPPFCGFVNYKDPMEAIFGLVDEETIRI